MATESGPQDPDVAPSVPVEPPVIERLLRDEPYRFKFFQAVRLLSELNPDRAPVGQFSRPSQEVVRFGTNSELGFPASEISGVEWPPGSQPRMRVNFMGLTGPMGLLPLYYSALLRERLRVKDTGIRDFLDIFNHRMLSFFYQGWEKYRFTVAYGRGERDRFSHHLLDLIGLGTTGLQERQAVSDEALLFYSGLLSSQTRSATALRQLLQDYFEVPVEIEQFVGAWYPLEEDAQCRFDGSGSYSEQLGLGAVIGDEVWDQQSGVRIRLGPLSLQQYLDFLPNGKAHNPLRGLIRFFSGNELSFEVQLVLRKEEAPFCELGGEGAAAPQLGWLTWAKSTPLQADPDQTILQI